MEYFQLVVTVCMISNQLVCEEKRFPFDSGGIANCLRSGATWDRRLDRRPPWLGRKAMDLRVRQ